MHAKGRILSGFVSRPLTEIGHRKLIGLHNALSGR